MTSDRNNNWNACEPGQLRELANSMRSETQKQQSAKMAWGALGGVGLAAILVVGIAFSGLLGGPDSRPGIQSTNFGPKGGITCGRCIEVYNDYVAGILDSEMMTRVSLHLDDCPHCRQRLGAEKSTRADPEQVASPDETLVSANF